MDIKQAVVCGILTALKKYDPGVGVPFVAFQKRYIQTGVEDYIRTAQSGVVTMTVDTTSQPDRLYFRAVLYDALHRAYDNLTYREQRTVAKHLGFCDTCWSVKKAVLINGEIEYRPIKPMAFEEISHSASRRSDKTSEQAFYAAMEKMMKHIETDADYRYIFR